MSPSARAARVPGTTPASVRHLALVASEVAGVAAPTPRPPRAWGAVVLVLTLGMLSLFAVVTTVFAALPGTSLPTR